MYRKEDQCLSEYLHSIVQYYYWHSMIPSSPLVCKTALFVDTMSTRGRAPNKKEERKATRQSGDNLPDDKSPDVEKKTTL